jgi:hypothetical protein
VARLRRKSADEGMPTTPPAAGITWWRDRILDAWRAGATTLSRPSNSRRICELMGLAEARRIWRTEGNKQPKPLTLKEGR